MNILRYGRDFTLLREKIITYQTPLYKNIDDGGLVEPSSTLCIFVMYERWLFKIKFQ